MVACACTEHCLHHAFHVLLQFVSQGVAVAPRLPYIVVLFQFLLTTESGRFLPKSCVLRLPRDISSTRPDRFHELHYLPQILLLTSFNTTTHINQQHLLLMFGKVIQDRANVGRCKATS